MSTDEPWDDDSGFWEDPATLRAIEELTIAEVKEAAHTPNSGRSTGAGPPRTNPPPDRGRGRTVTPSLVNTMTATPPRQLQPPQSQGSGQPAGVSIPSAGQYIISHSPRIQRELDRLGISWGVQYELARGETHGHWKWDDLSPADLESLVGLNSEAAPKVVKLMLGTQRSEPGADNIVWAEYDREQEAICESHDSRRSLGIYGDWAPWHAGPGEDWYGGRISQCARVVEDSGQFKIVLDPPVYHQNTSRFARFLGSRRMFRLSIPSGVRKDRLHSFLAQKFVLCGRVFVALRPKESKGGKAWKVYLIEVNENVDRSPKKSEGDHRRLTLQDFVRWHNPIELNRKQPTSKWITRFDLGLSPSVPVVEFDPKDVEFVHDTFPFGAERTDIRPRSGELIADGCGFMNRTALDLVTQRAGWSEFRCAVQGRLGGSKGVWLLHPDHQLPDDSPPRVWIRDSQKKITHDYSGPNDGRSRAYFILDLVAPARLVFPSRLNKQTITNLSSNGVPTAVFAEMLEAAVQKDFEDLTTWEGEDAMEFLLSNVARLGGVSGMRAGRKAGTMARIQGLRGREIEDIPNSQASELGFVEGDWESDTSSGPPLALSEKIFDMIIAGFHPLRSESLYDSLKQFILNVIRSYVYECKIPIPQSCEAFIVPDPFGILEHDEIYFRANQNIVEGLGGVNSDTVTGPVLINRDPTMLPSDMQLVTAVDKYHDIYQHYRNVIVCPVKGEQSLASKLAGGDYDGDTARLTWNQEIVSTFRQARLNPVPQGFLLENFDKQIEHVESFFTKISAMAESEAEREVHRVFVDGLLHETRTGIYSNFHNGSLYERGYGHPETLRLAHMTNTCLDSPKTGLRVREEVFRDDMRKYNKKLPESLSKDGDGSQEGRRPIRPHRLGQFVLDALLEHGKKIWEDHNEKYKKLKSKKFTGPNDPDLLRPHEEAMSGFTTSPHSEQLNILKKHIQKCRTDWKKLGSFARSPASPNAKARAAARQQQTLTVANIRKEFTTGPPPELIPALYSIPRGSRMVKEIKASFAYSLGEKFALEVAFHDLCALKAGANEDEYPVHGRFRDIMVVSPSVARRYNASRGTDLG